MTQTVWSLVLFLPIIGVRAVFAPKMFVQKFLLHAFDIGANVQSFARQMRDVFQNDGVFDGFIRTIHGQISSMCEPKT